MRSEGSFLQLLVLIVLLALPIPAVANKPIIVGNGTAASCTETALASALVFAEGVVGARTIKFHCGDGPVTIPLTATLAIPDNTTIDGGEVITLFGDATAEIALIAADTTVTLKGLIISNKCVDIPRCVLRRGGVQNHGTLTVDHTRFSDNFVDLTGLLTNFGTVMVKNSMFVRNEGFFLSDGGILNGGTLTVENTLFPDHFYDTFGGAITNAGTATIHSSTFIRNDILDGRGGAIINVGTLTIKNCSFSQNGGDGSDSGGAIYSAGTLTVENSTFSDNSATLGASFGGALYIAAGFGSVRNSEFSGNQVLTIGGAIANVGTLELVNSTVSHNRAFQNFFGSPGQGGGIFNSGSLTIINTSVSGNEASQGGGILNRGTLTLNNSIISDNTADVGGGIYNQGTLFTLGDTIVTGNTPDNIFPW